MLCGEGEKYYLRWGFTEAQLAHPWAISSWGLAMPATLLRLRRCCGSLLGPEGLWETDQNPSKIFSYGENRFGDRLFLGLASHQDKEKRSLGDSEATLNTPKTLG